jgi:PAS domain S-box-containing protein
MNPVAELLTGWTHTTALGTPLDDVLTLICEETGEQLENPALWALRKGDIETTGRSVLVKEGIKQYVDGSAAPIKDGNTVTGAVVVLRDITAHTHMENALKKTEKLYKAGQRELEERKKREKELRIKQHQLDELLTNVNAIVLEGDDTQILFVAGNVEALLGYSKNQWVSHPEGALGFWKDNIHPDDNSIIQQRDNAVQTCTDCTLEYRMIAADRHDVWVQDSTTITCKKDFVRVRSVMVDITERKTQEEELLQLSAAVKMSSDSIIITDIKGNITGANEAALAMYCAQKREDFIGKRVKDVVAPEDHKKVAINTKEVLKKGYYHTQEYDIITNDGDRVTLETNMMLIKTAEGTPKGIVSISRDITERKKAEREIKKKLMRYDLEEGTMYLAKERNPCTSVEAFQDLLTVGYPGLVISRTPKEEFTANGGHYDHVWIAEKGQKGIPLQLQDIESTIEQLTKATAIFIDRLDYLRSKTTAEKTLSFVQRLREIAYLKNHVIVLSVDPSIMDTLELRQIEKETAAIEPLYKTKLPEELFNTLKVIYEQNTKGVNPSYTLVGQHIGASKPTTRRRIRVLMSYGYVTASKKGRSKVVSLTEKGRALFL